jgi:hypothetical protein
MFNSRPDLIGISMSPGVFPVLISGPFYHVHPVSAMLETSDIVFLTVSRAMASGLPGMSFADCRALSMTD